MQKRVGPAWTERGRPPAGYFTRRTAEAWLRDVLDQARRGTLPELIRTGATFADAAAEYLRYAEHDRGCKPSTLRDYRSTIATHLLPAFGLMAVEDVDPATIERWRAGLPSTPKRLSRRTLARTGGRGRWSAPARSWDHIARSPLRLPPAAVDVRVALQSPGGGRLGSLELVR